MLPFKNAHSPYLTRAKHPSPEKRIVFKTVTLSPQKIIISPFTQLQEPPPKIQPFFTTEVPQAPSYESSSNVTENVSIIKGIPAISDTLEETKPPSSLTAILRKSRHMILKDFPLILDKTGPPRIPSIEMIKLIGQIFDGVFEVSINATYMIVRCRALPQRPWPITLGGIPLWITDSETDTPLAGGKAGRSPPILQDLRLSKVACPSGEVFSTIAQYFTENLDIAISEIMWRGTQLRLVVPTSAQTSHVPFKIGGLLALYDYTSAIPAYYEAAKRLVSPTPTVRDDTNYAPNLRPGVMLSCGAQGGEELFTSSGVLLKDPNDKKWLTVASHGFPLGNERVHHPNANSPAIADVEKIFEDTDISLARLHDGVYYSSQTFSSELSPAVDIKCLRKPTDLKIGDVLTMNNAFSGYCEGVFTSVVWRSIPENEERGELPWVTISSFYLGNGGEEPLDGSCGSPVLTEEGEVVGLFRFLTTSGNAYCASVEVLMEIGMTISGIN